jgi:hypothetical protein
MKYLKIFEDFSINEDRKINEYLETLPVWKEFIHKFEKMRDDIRRKANLELYSEDDSVAELLPNATLLDEWDLESIYDNWKSGYMKPIPFGKERNDAQTLRFDGLKKPEIGDLLIQFRGACWLFKPDSNFKFKFDSSAVWAHDPNPNMWDDISYLDQMCKSYVFEFRKDEIPMIMRQKLARNIRPTILSKENGYKRRQMTEQPYTVGDRTRGYTFKK